MKVSVIIPTKNEEDSIGKILQKIPREDVHEIVVVDRHSKDRTVARAKKELLPKRDKLVIQRHDGVGSALLQGADVARGDILIFMDGDGSHNPDEIPKLIEKIRRGYEFVFASRYAPGGRSENHTFIYWIGNRFFTFLTNAVHGTNVTDALYFFVAIKKETFQKLRLTQTGYGFGIELLVKAHQAGLQFGEIPAIEKKITIKKHRINLVWDGYKILRMILRRYQD